jgi:hypothetical protein
MRGGKRPGAGRKPGAITKIDHEARAKAMVSGETPLDYMLRVMRDQSAESSRRDDMAKAAAGYVHARLSSAEVKSETTVNYVARMPAPVTGMDEWQHRYSPSGPAPHPTKQ